MTDSTDTISGAEDRRSNQNRRVSIAPAEDDNRSGADRRQGGDRRGHFVNLMISDDAVIQDIFKWLIDNAGDNWTIGPNDNEPPESPVIPTAVIIDLCAPNLSIRWT
jgi:hypothetical protein